jgi:hypothetical protein
MRAQSRRTSSDSPLDGEPTSTQLETCFRGEQPVGLAREAWTVRSSGAAIIRPEQHVRAGDRRARCLGQRRWWCGRRRRRRCRWCRWSRWCWRDERIDGADRSQVGRSRWRVQRDDHEGDDPGEIVRVVEVDHIDRSRLITHGDHQRIALASHADGRVGVGASRGRIGEIVSGERDGFVDDNRRSSERRRRGQTRPGGWR